MKRSFFVIAAFVMVAAFIVAAAPATLAQSPAQSKAAAIVATSVPFTGTVPFLDLWKGSAHADAKAMAYNHWTTGKVDAACARCHTPAGFTEYITTGKVAAPVAAAPGHVLTCVGCHNDAATKLISVTFPSGAVVTDLGPEARCMTCHQGLQSTVSVNLYITDTFKITDYDMVVAPMITKGVTTTFGFAAVNPHYLAAAATQYGDIAKGGYEYAGKTYDVKFDHVLGINTCTACHDQHSLQVKLTVCATCHNNGKTMTVADLQNIREPSMGVDYNGNGNVTEGIAKEVKGLQDTLYKSIQSYAVDVGKTPIAYDPTTYPYFFVAGADGKPVKDAKGNTTAYSSFTARLLEAAYNLQFTTKDPGSFAHNPKYTIELLYDSIADLNTKLAKPVDMSKMHRTGSAHFTGDAQAFRDWDTSGEVPAGCARCHSATGLPMYLHNAGTLMLTGNGTLQVTGVVGVPPSNGFQCSTCHDEAAGFPARYAVKAVTFPSGASLAFTMTKDAKGNLVPADANLCLECHQGRESTVSVNKYLAAFKDADVVTSTIGFKNVHYLAAGATLFGTQAKGAYEYDGQSYDGYNSQHPLNKCTDCHDAHQLNVMTDACVKCHTGIKDPSEIRMATDSTDWNGNGDAKEPIKKEIATFQDDLYAAIQKYATGKGTPIVYDAASYPYYFVAGADGKATVDKTGAPVAYNAWTPSLLKAAYNYQYSIKDPGAFAHNPMYIMQVLYDSVKDIGGDVTKLTRPAAPTAK